MKTFEVEYNERGQARIISKDRTVEGAWAGFPCCPTLSYSGFKLIGFPNWAAGTAPEGVELERVYQLNIA